MFSPARRSTTLYLALHSSAHKALDACLYRPTCPLYVMLLLPCSLCCRRSHLVTDAREFLEERRGHDGSTVVRVFAVEQHPPPSEQCIHQRFERLHQLPFRSVGGGAAVHEPLLASRRRAVLRVFHKGLLAPHYRSHVLCCFRPDEYPPRLCASSVWKR